MNDSHTAVAPEGAVPAAALPLVVFGRLSGKAHASRFEANDAALAERAAGLMGLRVLRLATEEQRQLAAKVPAGRIFESGRAFVPFVNGALFEQLATAPEAFAPAPPAEADMPAAAPRRGKGGAGKQAATHPAGSPDNGARAPAKPVVDWSGITVGSVVLAAEEGAPETWWPAVVAAERGPDLFQLRWSGWPDEPLFVRRRDHLALLPPALAALAR